MISDVRRDAIFEEMNGYILSLDPSAPGPRYFIDKISICRNYLNNVSLVLSELQREKLVATSELSKRQTILELESDRLLATDENVQRMANIKDRQSMVAHMLREHRQRIDFLKDQIHTIEGLLKHVSLRNRELHATMDAIKNQRRFMQIEVMTGSFYGDERVPQLDSSMGVGVDGTSVDVSNGSFLSLPDQSSTEDVIAEMTDFIDPEASSSTFLGTSLEKESSYAPPPVVEDLEEVSDGEALQRFFGELKADTPLPEKIDEDLSFFLENL